MCNFLTQQIYYQLRCSYEAQPQPHPQQLQSPIIYSAMSHPELYRNGSPCESDHSPQPRGSVFELIHPMDRQYSWDSHKFSTSSEPRLSTSLYPPIIFSSAENGHNIIAASLPSASPNNETPTKGKSFKAKVKRWVSCDGLELNNVQKSDEHQLSLSAGAHSLKRNNATINTNFLSVHKHTRSKSLGLTQPKK